MKIKKIGDGITKDVKCWVGIDQSYSGFAITALGEDGSFMTQVGKLDDHGVRRLVLAKQYLKGTLLEIGTHRIADSAMEGYAFGSQMSNMLGELGGVVKTTLFETLEGAGKYPLIVPPTTLKKYVTGKGTGVQKNQMLLFAYKKWRIEFLDDNACDSYGLAHLVSGQAKLAYEVETWEKMQDPKHREN